MEVDADEWKAAAKAEFAADVGLVAAGTEAGFVVAVAVKRKKKAAPTPHRPLPGGVQTFLAFLAVKP